MLEHLESGTCSSGINIQVVNALVATCQDARVLVIQGLDSFLRAGPPRNIAHDTDLNLSRNTWKCPYCKSGESFLSALDLTRHLQTKNYVTGYPDVLKCPGCTATFSKLSMLSEHVENIRCTAAVDSGPYAALINYLKTELCIPDVKEHLHGLKFTLRADPHQHGLLCVMVTQKIKPSSVPNGQI